MYKWLRSRYAASRYGFSCSLLPESTNLRHCFIKTSNDCAVKSDRGYPCRPSNIVLVKYAPKQRCKYDKHNSNINVTILPVRVAEQKTINGTTTITTMPITTPPMRIRKLKSCISIYSFITLNVHSMCVQYWNTTFMPLRKADNHSKMMRRPFHCSGICR